MIAASLLVLSLLPLSFGRPAPASPRDFIGDILDHVAQMPMVIALNPNNKTGLVDTLMDISDPASPNYRKFLSKEEVCITLLAPVGAC